MGVPTMRRLIGCALILVLPASLLAGGTSAAMLTAGGDTWLNGTTVLRTSAIFPGDLIQTRAGAAANINTAGSLVTIGADSLVKYEGDGISVEHGRIAVSTSRKITTRTLGVIVVPVSDGLTQFEIASSDGTVQVAARTGDVLVTDGDGTTTVPQGQQTTVDDSEKKKKKRRKAAGAVPASGGPWLDSPVVIWTGVGVVGGVTLWVLLRGDEPMSDDTPLALAVH